MPDYLIVDISHQAVKITAMLGAPMLGSALLIGLVISLFQAVTQINEQTLTFIPKIIVVGGCLVLFGPWMIDVLTTYTRELFIEIPAMVLRR